MSKLRVWFLFFGLKGQYNLAQGNALGDKITKNKNALKGQDKIMSQSLSQVYVHIVFSTKERYPFIQPDVETELFAYIGDTINRLDGVPHLINGTADHVHLLSSLPRTIALSKYIEDIKRNSSRWLKTKNGMYQKFGWQNGYGAFSVSSSQKDAVISYIAGQKEHHCAVSFKEEYLSFLKKYNVKYDEQYLWD
jgi:putative transposase